MNPNRSGQDVLRCSLCETPVPIYHCDFCKINLCKSCAGEHLLNESQDHTVVPIQQQWAPNYPKCQVHSMKNCELYCEQCELDICTQCISFGDHDQHEKITIFKRCENVKMSFQKALNELENFVFPQYQKAASSIAVHNDELVKTSETISNSIREQGEVWHKEIDVVIQKLQSELNDMIRGHQRVLQKEENEISCRISEICKSINDLRNLLDSHDLSLVSACKFRIDDYRTLPYQLVLDLPKFCPQSINKKHLCEQFGSLSPLLVTMEVPTYPAKLSELEFTVSDKLLDEPEITACIDTHFKSLYNVACRNDDEIWTRGLDKVIRMYNFKGELLESIQTRSWNEPYDIAVLQSRELVYTDPKDCSVNIVRNAQVEPLIRLAGWVWTWKPLGVCSTTSGDLLVTMVSFDHKQTKVVRYRGSKEKQSIQLDIKGQPLYSSGYNTMYLSENKNFDICVADFGANAVVVVTTSGKFRFRYTGFSNDSNGSFIPIGIATDSQCRILTTNYISQCIHIIDQNGKFIRLIDNCNLSRPWGLCTDTKDNLIVAEWNTGKVKKLIYTSSIPV
uniref:Uncharacterized protein LOC111115570 n=1 Tax=Crassostrea virginica TaxID=6565 RepID=A0A8B8C4N5_CRAVI|nr:uncharacterized protein LOC111115570 [Crassostrea virginica]